MTTMSPTEMKRLVLRNDLAELTRLAGWIEGFVRHGVSPDLSFAIQLCLEEAVANVIMYGAAGGDRLEIAVELERNGGALVARVEDDGRHFDPTGVAPPPLERKDEARRMSFITSKSSLILPAASSRLLSGPLFNIATPLLTNST